MSKVIKNIGHITTCGYRIFYKKKKPYLEHRVIWEKHNGKIPKGLEIDHINHDRLDNRIENLRLVTKQENQRNAKRRIDNTSGVTGVVWRNENKRWYAQIGIDGKNIHLGCFSEFSDAVNARKNAEVLYGFHKNHGKDL